MLRRITFELRVTTSPEWLPLALDNFDQVLLDHAHCEKKAAANALSLLQAYPEIQGLPLQMAKLAREESAHLIQVLQLLEAREIGLGKDLGDPYAQALQETLRNPYAERRLDRLLVAGIIEARSCERLSLLAEGLSDSELRKTYADLARSEAAHRELFLRFAVQASGKVIAFDRLDELLAIEASIQSRLPTRPAIH